jgi:hypothetical protein
VLAGLLEVLLDKEMRGRIRCFNSEYARGRFAASKVVVRIENIYRDVWGGSAS